jgi:hypothetical protein
MIHHQENGLESTNGESTMITKRILWIVLLVAWAPVLAAAQGLDTTKIDQALGRSGQKNQDVYRVAFPRTDLHVTVAGVSIKPGFALGSWAAFSGNDANATVMGDLVLLEGEINAVMAKLRSSGIEITAVHNHLLNETPRIVYMHYLGHGNAVELAASVHAALALSKTPLGPPAASVPGSAPGFVKTIEDVLDHKGQLNGGVLAFGIARVEAINEDGMPLSGPQGVLESINFQETSSGEVATTGDFILTAQEINPVISALQEHNIQITALHNHMLTEEPRLFFMHFWATGKSESVAEGIKAALSHIAVK